MAPLPDRSDGITLRNPILLPMPMALATIMVAYSVAKHKLTPAGGATAFATALLHASFPSETAWLSLIVFFVAGTVGTRAGKRAKAHLTVSASGGSGAEGARNAVQVLANSGAADAIILLSAVFGPALLSSPGSGGGRGGTSGPLFGIVCSYAAAAADTLSSELGILSSSAPFMITPPFRRVPRGTNGGVTLAGLAAGLLGSSVLAALYFAGHGAAREALVVAGLGLAGSVLDSVLGAVAQATVEDKKTGRVVEGANGRRVLVGQGPGASRVRRGADWLNNNGVNFSMTLAIGLVGWAVYPHVAAVEGKGPPR